MRAKRILPGTHATPARELRPMEARRRIIDGNHEQLYRDLLDARRGLHLALTAIRRTFANADLLALAEPEAFTCAEGRLLKLLNYALNAESEANEAIKEQEEHIANLRRPREPEPADQKGDAA